MASLATPFYSSFAGIGRLPRMPPCPPIRGARLRGTMLDSSVGSSHSARIPRAAASRGKVQEEEPAEEEDIEDLLPPEKLRQQRDLMNDIMKKPVTEFDPEERAEELAEQVPVEQEFLELLEDVAEVMRDEKPSKGMEQLLALVESSRAFEEPPPPRIPQRVQNIAVITGYAIFLYVVAYVTLILDLRDERRELEEEARKAEEEAAKEREADLEQAKDKDLEQAKESMERSLESEFSAAAAGRMPGDAQKPPEKRPQVLSQLADNFRSFWSNITGKWKKQP